MSCSITPQSHTLTSPLTMEQNLPPFRSFCQASIFKLDGVWYFEVSSFKAFSESSLGQNPEFCSSSVALWPLDSMVFTDTVVINAGQSSITGMRNALAEAAQRANRRITL